MQIREKYSAEQLVKLLERVKKQKVTIKEFFQCTLRCTVESAIDEKVNLILGKSEFYEQLTDEDVYFFATNVQNRRREYSRRSGRRIDDALYNRKQMLTNIFKSKNLSLEGKKYIFAKGITSWDVADKFLNFHENESMLTAKDQIDAFVMELKNSPNKPQRYEVESAVNGVIMSCKHFKSLGKSEWMEYAFNQLQENIDFSVPDFYNAKLKVSGYFNQFCDYDTVYAYARDIIKDNISWRITNVIENENIPLGMCVKAFVEYMTKNIMSIDKETEESLSASMLAVRMLKAGEK
jgi:hypothetical protein